MIVSQAKCILLLVGLCLTACDSSVAKPAALTVWIPAHPSESAFYQQMLNRYQAQHPQVALKLVQIPFETMKPRFVGQAKAKREPDVLLFPNDWTGELSQSELLQPLQMKASSALTAPTQAFQYQNRLYAFPLSFQVAALIRNQKLVPTAPQSWAQLEKTTQTLRRQGQQGLMYDNKSFYYHAAWFHAYGGHLGTQSGKLSLTPAPLQASLEFARHLEQRRVIASRSSYSVMSNLFNAGQLGMMISGPWALSEARRNQIQVAVSPLPPLPNGAQPRPFLGAKGWGINAYSAAPQAAQSLAQWLSSLEVQREMVNKLDELGSHPALYQGQSPLSAEKQGFFLQSQLAVPLPNHPAMKTLWAELNWSLNQALDTQRPSQTIVAETMKRLQQL